MRGLWLALVWLTVAFPAHAGSDPKGAVRALLATPFRVTGDVVAAGGLVTASVVGLLGDGVSIADDPWLLGVLSFPAKRMALGVSQLSTGALEGLRAEDVERLPEAREAYIGNAPGAGRLDTLLTGLGAIRLGLEDLVTGPALFGLRMFGASGAVDEFVRDERIRVLGPLVRETEPPAES